jgi:hypothetical protein
MKKIILFALMFSAVIVNAQDKEKDKEAIKNVIQTAYVDGLQNEGDTLKIDSGIHPDFNLLGIGKDNSMWAYSITDWKANVVKKLKEGELPKSGDDFVTVKFTNIDITGTAAVAKIEFYVGENLTYVDYIALYKFDEGWKMINKIFYKF